MNTASKPPSPARAWLQRNRRSVTLLVVALCIAAAQAAVYPWLYAATPAQLYSQANEALQCGEHRRCLTLLNRLHRRVPSLEISRFMAGWCHHCLKDYDAAITEYNRAMQYTPGYPQTYANLGCLLKEQGRWREAVELFQRHLLLVPGDAGSRAALEECQRRAAAGR